MIKNNSELLLNNEQIREFARKKQTAMLYLYQATEEYASSRCLLLNGLIPGLIFSAQAVEKFLKVFIMLKDPKYKPKSSRHNLFQLFKRVKIYIGDGSWDKYDGLVKRLRGHYQSRYPDNTSISKIMSANEIHEIDELVMEIVMKLDMPDEVKYRAGVLVNIYESTKGSRFPTSKWITEQNKSINLYEIIERSIEVERFLNNKK